MVEVSTCAWMLGVDDDVVLTCFEICSYKVIFSLDSDAGTGTYKAKQKGTERWKPR